MGRKLISTSRETFAVDLAFTISCLLSYKVLYARLRSNALLSFPIDDADVNINKNSFSPKILRCLFKNLSRFVLHEIGARERRSAQNLQ